MPGLGSSQHLTSELLLRAAGDLRVTHVPYRGGGPLLQDLLAGTIDAGVVTFSAGAQQARAGHLVALAVTSEARARRLSGRRHRRAETVAPGFVQTTWQGLLAPKGTPEPILARIHSAMLAVLKDPAVAARLRELGFDPVGLDGAGFAKLSTARSIPSPASPTNGTSPPAIDGAARGLRSRIECLRTRSAKKKITKNTSGWTTPIGASQPLFSMMNIVTQKTAVAITAVRNATQTGRKSFTQPARALGWPAAGRRVPAAGR